MEPLLDEFKTVVMGFRVKGHDLLDYHSNRFDRDFVDFSVRQVEKTGSRPFAAGDASKVSYEVENPGGGGGGRDFFEMGIIRRFGRRRVTSWHTADTDVGITQGDH